MRPSESERAPYDTRVARASALSRYHLPRSAFLPGHTSDSAGRGRCSRAAHRPCRDARISGRRHGGAHLVRARPSARRSPRARDPTASLLEVVSGNGALGAGFVTGVIQGEPGVGAFRVRARGWRQVVAASQLSLSVEATRLLGAWYSDVVGGVTVDRSRVVGSLWLSGRVSRTSASSGAASASLQYFLTPTIAVEASGGNYLRDPFQGLPRAG